MDILFALWFFLPAGVANMTPIFLSRLPGFKDWSAPLDFGKTFNDQVIFGKNKTWRGLIGGTVTGALVILFQRWAFTEYSAIRELVSPLDYSDPNYLWLGALLGAGALLGDAAESFLKRRANVPPGEAWFPFDQTDYILGGLLLSLLVVQLEFIQYVIILITWFVMHLAFSYIGYRISLKDKPI